MIAHDRIIESIAATVLDIETLEVRGRDNLDFHSLAVWQVKEALQAAFEAGRKAAGA